MATARKREVRIQSQQHGLITKGGLRAKITEVKAGIEKFAQLLTRNYGLKVQFRGAECHTNGKVITLPELGLLERRNMTDEELNEALDFLMTVRGYVNHEASHILFTDFKLIPQAHKEGGHKKQFVLNALEDLRIETKMRHTYAGAEEVLQHLHRWSFNKLQAAIEEEGGKTNRFSQLVYGILAAGYDNVWDDPKKNPVWQYVDKDLQKLVLKFRPKILRARRANSTRAIMGLVNEIWEEMKDEYAKEKKLEEAAQNLQKALFGQQSGGSPGSQGAATGAGNGGGGADADADDSGAGEDGGGGGSSGGRGPTAGGGEDEDEQLDGGGGGGGPQGDEDAGEGDQEEDAPGAGEADDEGEEDASDEAGADGGAGGGEAEDDSEAGEGEGGEEDAEVPAGNQPALGGDEDEDDLFDNKKQLEDDEQPQGIEETLQNHMKETVVPAALSAFDGKYLVYTTEGDRRDKVEVPDVQGAKAYVKTIADEVRSAVGPLKRVLEARLRARSLSYRVGGMTEGKLNRSSLHRLPLDLGTNVFYQDVVGQTLNDTCVGLVYDSSGSMYSVMRALHHTLFTFGEVLELMKVSFMSWGFTTGGNEGHQRVSRATAEERQLFTRFGDVRLHVLKDFDEKWPMVRHRLYGVRSHMNAYDGECLRIAATELILRPEKKKFLFVFCDGEPCGNMEGKDDELGKYLREVAHELTAQKRVNVMGVGINTESPKYYYPRSFTTYNPSDLAPMILKELGGILL